MKMYHYSILFSIIAVCIIVVLDLSFAEMIAVKQEVKQLYAAFEVAIAAAMAGVLVDHLRPLQ